MSLATLDEVLIPARAGKYAVGAYDFTDMEMLYGILDAAEQTRTPVILQYPDAPELMENIYEFGPMMVAAAKKATVPVVVHLDHGKSFESCKKCADVGFTGIMIDASVKPYAENVAIVKEVVDYCKPLGIPVEGEIGHVGQGDEYDPQNYFYTDPEQAAQFVKETGISAVAVAIGNAHGAYKSEPKINYEVLSKIEELISIPLVLHGGSGISDADFKKIIKHGVAKVNIFTELTQEAAAELQAIPHDQLNLFNATAAIRTGFRKRTLEKIELFETKPISE